MLPPLYLLWILWPSCPFVPTRHRIVKPLEIKPGTHWFRKQASLDPMREPLHIRHFPRHYGSSFAALALLEAECHRAKMAFDKAAEGQDRTVLVVRGREDAIFTVPAVPVAARAGWDEAARPKKRSSSKWAFHPARPVQNYRTLRTGQKPWRRPRGLTSAARRRQNSSSISRSKGRK